MWGLHMGTLTAPHLLHASSRHEDPVEVVEMLEQHLDAGGEEPEPWWPALHAGRPKLDGVLREPKRAIAQMPPKTP